MHQLAKCNTLFICCNPCFMLKNSAKLVTIIKIIFFITSRLISINFKEIGKGAKPRPKKKPHLNPHQRRGLLLAWR
jgi:hypothetical protein